MVQSFGEEAFEVCKSQKRDEFHDSILKQNRQGKKSQNYSRTPFQEKQQSGKKPYSKPQTVANSKPSNLTRSNTFQRKAFNQSKPQKGGGQSRGRGGYTGKGRGN
jgi:hypothetical protein